MLKNILKLKGAQELTKNEQKSINGSMKGNKCCDPELACCVPNPNWNGFSGCQFLPSSYPVCI